MDIESLPDASPEIELAVKHIIQELLRICPLELEPSVRVKESEHASCYRAAIDTIYICVPEASDLPPAEEFREFLRQPHTWSGIICDIIEEFVHAYQERLSNTEPSADALRFWGKYAQFFEGEGHDARFFEASLLFAHAADIQGGVVISTMAGRFASDYGG